MASGTLLISGLSSTSALFVLTQHQPIRLPRWYNGGGFRSSISTRRGGDHVRPTQSRSAVVPLGRRGLRPADGQALPYSDGRGHFHHRTPHNHQSAPRRRRAGSRPSLQLSPRLLAAPLVVVALGPRPGRSHPPRHWVPEGSVALAGDDTVDEHGGAHVYGKGRHRDPVRSTHSYTAYRWGRKWVVLAILVRFPFANRPWALPVLVALYRSREWNQQHRRRHRTPLSCSAVWWPCSCTGSRTAISR